MRAFLTCALLAVALFAANTVPAQAWYHYYRGPVVVLRPAPILVGPRVVVASPAPVVVAPPVVYPYAPAPVVVAPRPFLSVGVGIR